MYLRFDGVDDSLATASIDFTSTDKATVVAGVRKLSDAATGMISEFSPSASSNAGAFYVIAPGSAAYGVAHRGATTAAAPNTAASYPAPTTNVVTLSSNLGAPLIIARVNGIQAASQSSATGGGNFGNYPLFIGRRNNASLPFNGNLYGLIIMGAFRTPDQIRIIEKYLGDKSGVAL
jgi:hypothetical protein